MTILHLATYNCEQRSISQVCSTLLMHAFNLKAHFNHFSFTGNIVTDSSKLFSPSVQLIRALSIHFPQSSLPLPSY